MDSNLIKKITLKQETDSAAKALAALNDTLTAKQEVQQLAQEVNDVIEGGIAGAVEAAVLQVEAARDQALNAVSNTQADVIAAINTASGDAITEITNLRTTSLQDIADAATAATNSIAQLVTDAQNAVTDAETAATQAGTARDQAQTAATNAGTARDQAQDAATTAGDAATSATNTAAALEADLVKLDKFDPTGAQEGDLYRVNNAGVAVPVKFNEVSSMPPATIFRRGTADAIIRGADYSIDAVTGWKTLPYAFGIIKVLVRGITDPTQARIGVMTASGDYINLEFGRDNFIVRRRVEGVNTVLFDDTDGIMGHRGLTGINLLSEINIIIPDRSRYNGIYVHNSNRITDNFFMRCYELNSEISGLINRIVMNGSDFSFIMYRL